MCVISHKYKLIFIRCRKSASTSFQYALSKVSGPYDIISPFHDKDIDNSKHAKNNWFYIPSRKAVFYNHIPAFRVREMIAYMDKSIWNTYFKFCFERNPWDRAISEYWHNQRGGAYTGMTLKEFVMHGTFHRFSSWRFYTDEERENIIIDKVFKYEEMDEAIKYLIERGNLPEGFKLSDYRFKGDFRKNHSHYRDLLGEEERKRIEEIYHREIKEFGYRW